MRTYYFIALIILAAPLFIYSSCKKTATKDPCEKVICTMIFAGVGVHITNKDGDPVTLDDAYTVREGTIEKIRHNNYAGTGNYTVLDDGYQKKLAQSTAQFRFFGRKNGQEVVNEVYTISADCCHIKKESGKTEVALP